jgi:two-component system, OmpR family, alkaline phosphatase synthesis response regulator PhoP
MNKKILVIEDEDDIRELLRYNLEKAGYDYYEAPTGESGWNKIQDIQPDLILLDIMLPGIDGLEVCSRIKIENGHKNYPVIMLTARGEEEDIVKGLDLGADDYVTKPFSMKVLLARIAKIFRTQLTPLTTDNEILKTPGITLDPRRHEVKVDGESVQLTSSEFKTLSIFLKNQGRVFTRTQIMEKVHGEGYVVSERAIDVMIVGLRKKLKEYGGDIETIRGIGYRMAEI